MAEAVNDQPLSHLRGAGVDTDARRVAWVAGYLVAVVLAALAVTFLLVGLGKNNQINQLQQHGVIVDAQVSGCLGELSGTGSNVAGYSCRASFSLAGVPYHVTIPGDALRLPGSHACLVTLPSDPNLVETPGTLANEHSTFGVFVLPIVLFVAFFVLVVAMTSRRKRRNRSKPMSSTPTAIERGLAPG